MSPSQPSSGRVRVLIVDDVVETRDNVKKLLYFEDDIEIVGNASTGNEGVELAGKLLPDIVLMDINMPGGMDGIAATEAIAARYPNIQVIMMSVQGEADYLRRSMLAGAREFLTKPFSSDELATSLRRVYQLGAARRVQMPPTPPPVAPPPPPPQAPKESKVIAVFGTKGGCGASTIAVNVAIGLREDTKARVALVDANLEMGDIAVLLNLPGNRTICDLAGPDIPLDEEVVNGVMATHGSGVKVLLAPPQPEMEELITSDLLKKVVGMLAQLFDYVVIDVCRTFHEPMVSLLDAADEILLIATSEIPSIKNTKLFFELTQQLGYKASKILLIVNKEDGRSTISAKDIESSIQHPVTAILPKDERTTLSAAQRGTPFISTTQKTLPLTQAVKALVQALRRPEDVAAVAAAQPPSRPKLFRRL